jgi:hypothetical protein
VRTPTAIITHPIALCAYVISLVFALLAKKWNSKSRTKQDRQLFYLASFLCVAALAGGLFLAWQQIPKSQPEQPKQASGPPAAGTDIQTSFGANSPNVKSSGSGAVTVQVGAAPTPPPAKADKKKK